MTIAGLFTEVFCQHSIVGNRKLDLKSGESTELDRGGLRIADDENNRTASGGLILQYENKQPYIQFTCAVDGDVEDYVNNIIKESMNELPNWTLTHVSGDIYVGFGTIVGDVKPDRYAGTLQIKVAFEGDLLRI
jgi:hypothetical protein